MLQNASECIRMLQNASECFRLLQNASECIRRLQNLQRHRTDLFKDSQRAQASSYVLRPRQERAEHGSDRKRRRRGEERVEHGSDRKRT